MRSRRPIPAHNVKVARSGRLKRRNLLWRWRRLFYLVALVMITGVAGAGFVVSKIELPTAPPPGDQTTFICDASVGPGQCNADTALAEMHGEEDRVNVTIDQIPQVVINAVIAAEDRDFFEHDGVDPVGITRAALSDIRGNSASRQGGSTITQQYVKNTYLSDERTLTRKIREAVMAIKLEQEISKEQILENYLNTIYFGRGAYGVQAASQAYFDKNVGEVSLPEAALLAGLVRSPQRAEPYKFPEEARRRRRTVLDAMLEEGMITRAERDLSDEVTFDPEHGLALWAASDGVEVRDDAKLIGAEYFVEHVRKQLTARYGNDAVFGGGLRVYTTLDLGRQADAYAAVTENLDQPDDPAGALVAIDDQGQVAAMMGGRDYDADKVNLATGRSGGGSGRQPGSTFKAFALAQAVREGYSIESVLRTPSSRVFPNANAGEDWTVEGGCCNGNATLVEATARSANTGYAQLMIDLGPERVIEMAEALGVSAEFEVAVPSLVLGSGEVSVLDMAAAYSTFAHRGTRIETRAITRVERADGTVIDEFTSTRTEVLTIDQASRVTYALQQVVEAGTGVEAAIGRPAAGKTGTTQNNKDAWFVGYTPTLTASVWMGYPIPREMASVHGQTVQGGNIPARIWRRFMELSLEGTEPVEFMEPANLDEGEVLDPELGTGSDEVVLPGADGDANGDGVDDDGIIEPPPDGTDAPEGTEEPEGTEAPTVPTDPVPPDVVPTDPVPTDPVPPVPDELGADVGLEPDG